jgi:regulator of protease activity HflC (stomatin/prohibitin superfamily)
MTSAEYENKIKSEDFYMFYFVFGSVKNIIIPLFIHDTTIKAIETASKEELERLKIVTKFLFKVNDKTGNPVMIGMVVVWKVTDTYKASFDIDNASMTSTVAGAANIDNVGQKMKAYENFVKIQSDSALRYVAGLYAYDHTGTADESELTLRSGGEDVNTILEQQINERLVIAGIEVVEARLNYLAYAPEIAAVMLRRQQADAIIAAREKIVDGAVGMVKMALNKLADEGIVDLDEDKKAAMVSNLLVVLCSEDSTQPVVNAGTLHQ